MKARNPLKLTALTLCLAVSAQAFISEPESLVYGRIINRSGPVDQLITEGTLTWKLTGPDGTELFLNALVAPMNDGTFSYSMAIPHQALSLGQVAAPTVVPLGTTPSTQVLTEITYNGQQARIMAPASSSFDVYQAQRAATHRIDLEINIPMMDTDHDGMPDWWEDANGLDKQLSDALLDPDGDGRNNLSEYLAGLDPNQDSRIPRLRTTEIVAYSQGTSVVMLEASDMDSTPQQLTYTLMEAPVSGALMLRNADHRPASTDRQLAQGSTFSQQDVFNGRLVYMHDFGNEPVSFKIRIADEAPSHSPADGVVRVLLFDPLADTVAADSTESMRLAAHSAASVPAGAIVADLASLSGDHILSAPSGTMTTLAYGSTYVPAYGEDRPHYLIGGPGTDTLTGGMKADLISGGAGVDQLSGKGGSDLFLYTSSKDGNDSILDFSQSEGDKIDIASLLTGSSLLLTDYVRISRSGADALLGIRFDGTATGYADMVIRLANSPLTQSSLRPLYESGNLLTGRAMLPPQVTVVASVAHGSENGPTAGQFVISRSMTSEQPLTVALQITGSASNGIDYFQVAPTIIIPSGALSASLDIQPYQDAVTELDEVVQISLLTQPGYEIGTNAMAQVIIDDLKPQVTVQPLNALAEVNTQSPGAFLLERSGVVDRSVLVRLTIGGNATNGIDYNRIENYVNLGPFQTTSVIQITPKPTASLQKGAESVILTVKTDSTYRVGNPAMAMVVIVPETIDLGVWRQTNFAGNNQTLDAFSRSDPGNYGLTNLVRYGFGLNAANPRQGAAEMLPRPEIRNGHLAIRFQKSPAALDLDYQVEISNDMRNWHLGGTELQDISPMEPGGDPTTAVYQMVDGLNQAKAKFMRVRLMRIQP